MEEKTRFIAAVLTAEESMAELCAEFGISRKTGYKWLARYQEGGPVGLYELSRARRRVPWAISEAQAAAIVGVRRAHPRWGPRKLRVKLSERAPQEVWPAPSTIGELLRRRGLTQARKRRRHAVPNADALTVAVAANDLWCIDWLVPHRRWRALRSAHRERRL